MLRDFGRPATMDTCRVFSRQAFPARYIVPANDTAPVPSAIRVTVGPLVALRAVRCPCLGGLTLALPEA
ncbi:MAG: hypothetical protein H0V07_03850 [Propionibacteriales bacterium]|nr:hypothetical protein [Propionibacteriales bacterium]